MSKVLIIHHLETMWENGYKKFGTSMEKLCLSIAAHIRRSKYDEVILTRFEECELEPEHSMYCIGSLIDTVYDFGYGYEPECFMYQEKGKDWCDGGSHSDALPLPDWLWDIKKASLRVNLCGAFDGECVEDMEVVLSYLGIKYKRLEKLIV